jgi:hypothetical protein
VPKGDPRDPMTADEIDVKATALGKGVIGEAKCKQMRQVVMGLENERDVSRLLASVTR